MKNWSIYICIFLITAFSGCKKDESSNWERCLDCSREMVIGTYSGKATLQEFDEESVLINTVHSDDAYLMLTVSGNNSIDIPTGVINVFNASINAQWNEGNYTISSFSDGEFHAEIWHQGNQIKIKGMNKRYSTIIENDSVVPVLRSFFDFEVIKTE